MTITQICRLFKDPISVLVEVGIDGNDCWTLPKGVLVAKSKFFAKALSGIWAEAASKTITLPEEEPVIFEMFVQWLLTSDIGDLNPNDSEEEAALRLAKAWILGDRLDCPIFKDLIMDSIITMHHEEIFMWGSFKALAFIKAPASSQLCRFVILQHMYDSRLACPESIEERPDRFDWSTDLAAKVMLDLELARLMPFFLLDLHSMVNLENKGMKKGEYLERFQDLLKKEPEF